MMEMHTRIQRERGQSMVEFAFGIVILLILLAGIVDAGRALLLYMAIREAVQEGALYGSINPTDEAGIRERVRMTSNTTQSISADLAVDVDLLAAACSGNGIKVSASYPNFRIATPFLGAFVGTQLFTIRASATDTILSPPCP